MNRREFVGFAGAGLAGLWVVRREAFVERWSWAMGQPVHLMVFAGSEDEGLDAATAALAELRRVEARLSSFDDASDLSELNRHAGRSAMRADTDLRAVLELSQAMRRATDGAFDVAVEPLMRIWGFHRPRRTEPTPAEIAEARAAVRAAEVRLAGDRAFLPSAHTQLDFGGIGVGYGIDRALAVLRRRGVRRAFIDVSGDCAALDAPPGRDGWLVSVPDPRRPGASVVERRLRNAALATSANTAVRGHVMDPTTGRPAAARRQATVVARTAVAADALSTGALVSGRRPAGVQGVYSLLVAGVLLAAGVAGCRAPREGPTIARAWDAMGTVFSAAVWGPDSAALDRALERAADSVRAVDSLRARGRLIPMDDPRLNADSAAEGSALDRAALALVGVADSALLSLGGPMLWVGTRPTHRQVRIGDPEDALRPLFAVELTAGALSTTAHTERHSPRSVTVLAASAAAADAWSAALFPIGCARALDLAAGRDAPRVSVICADSGGLRWTPDLEGRVTLSRRAEPARGP